MYLILAVSMLQTYYGPVTFSYFCSCDSCKFFRTVFHRTNYGMFRPINSIWWVMTISALIDFSSFVLFRYNSRNIQKIGSWISWSWSFIRHYCLSEIGNDWMTLWILGGFLDVLNNVAVYPLSHYPLFCAPWSFLHFSKSSQRVHSPCFFISPMATNNCP